MNSSHLCKLGFFKGSHLEHLVHPCWTMPTSSSSGSHEFLKRKGLLVCLFLQASKWITMGEWSYFEDIPFNNLKLRNKLIHSRVVKLWYNFPSTTSYFPCLLAQVYWYPSVRRSCKLQSMIAYLKPFISHVGWSTKPILSSLESKSLRSPKMHQGREVLVARDWKKFQESFLLSLLGKW